MWGFFCGLQLRSQLPLNALAENPCGLSIGVIIIYAVDVTALVMGVLLLTVY
jgi:hypothetical protein